MIKFLKQLKVRVFYLFFALIIILFSMAFVLQPNSRDFAITKNLDIFFSFIREINLFYVDEIDPEAIIENAIFGVLEGVDPYTTYIPESEMENFATATTGRYGGIGAIIRKSGDYIMIVEPYENFPAQKAGLRAGDLIIEIDGKSIKGADSPEVSEMLKGLPNSNVLVTVKRGTTGEIETHDIERKEVKINNVAWHGTVADKIGYIQFNGFTEDAYKEVKTAFEQLKKSDSIEYLILDLRGNPGGLLIEAVAVTNLFVNKGQEIVSTRGKVPQWDQVYKATNDPVDADIPLIVLVGRSSASASEIVAGAIQDLDRGILIGERTFGKGLVQTTRQLSYNAQLKVTTAKYYTPSGRSIQSQIYSAEGMSSSIPDSLINMFATKNGRIVYDGGGILPDININPDPPTPFLINLFSKELIFDFATNYAANNPSIQKASEFKIDESTFKQFATFISDREFKYQTETEQVLNRLQTVAAREKSSSDIDDAIMQLRTLIDKEKENDLINNKSEITSLLEEEIVSRYYFQKGRIEASIKSDMVIEKAISLFSTPEKYYEMLQSNN